MHQSDQSNQMTQIFNMGEWPLPVIVKNTFIDLESPAMCSHTRSRSLPASQKFKDKTMIDSSDASTEACSEVGRDEAMRNLRETSSDEEDALSQDLGPMEPDSESDSGENVPCLEPPQRGFPPAFTTAPWRLELEENEAAGLPVETPLRLRAPSFENEMTPQVEPQAAHLAGAVWAVLRDSAPVTRAVAINTSRGWMVVAYLQSAEPILMDSTLTLAKSVLLRAAEESSCTYVLGYETNPFLARPYGFVCSLVAMEDESKACWNYFRTGFCSRGCACKWQHPANSISVEVQLAFA
jgi:hypothetical protein